MSDDDDEPVPLANVSGAIMRKVGNTEALAISCTSALHEDISFSWL